MLEVKGLESGYGDIQVLWGLSFNVDMGAFAALVGPNGAGKSTLLKTLAGLVRANGGSVLFNGEEILHLSADERVKRGIILVPEGRRLYPGMTVRENLMMGAYTRFDKGGIREDLERVLLLFPPLVGKLPTLAGKLSGGLQQMCAIGRGLMSRPKLLLIDEFSLGLAPLVVKEIVRIITQINGAGTSVFIVEQDVHAAFSNAQYGFVLERGRLTNGGKAQLLLQDERIKKAYLGL
jgi:branched-chain amino acid transport system ATP-binding protein